MEKCQGRNEPKHRGEDREEGVIPHDCFPGTEEVYWFLFFSSIILDI